MKPVRIIFWPTIMPDKVGNQIVIDAVLNSEMRIVAPDAIFGIWGKVLAPDRWPFVLLKDGRIDWGDGDMSTSSIRKEIMQIGATVTIELNLREEGDLTTRWGETGYIVKEVVDLI